MHVFNQQMKYNYRYQQSIRGGGSYPKKTKVKPDPVLWFPGGDADCGTNAQGKNMSKSSKPKLSTSKLAEEYVYLK